MSQAPIELGVANIVTGILIAYRGFDTLGEVAVLFMVAASVGLLLRKDEAGRRNPEERRRVPASEIVTTGSQVLLPVIFTFGAYVIVNGHLSAGGGFQGGAIVASGVMLLLLADPGARLNATALSVIESLAGMAYVAIGMIGLVLAGGFLDPRFLPPGEVRYLHQRAAPFRWSRHCSASRSGQSSVSSSTASEVERSSPWQRSYRYPPSCWSQASASP